MDIVSASIDNKNEEGDIIFDNARDKAILTTYLTLAAILVLSVLLSVFFTRNIGAILRKISDELNIVLKDVVNGKLNTRIEVEKINHEFKGITIGVNDTLDALVKPLKVSADHIQRISKGDMPQLITDQYYGDFNDIKESINLLISSLNEITDKARLIALGDLIS